MGTELNSQLEDVESDYVKAVHRWLQQCFLMELLQGPYERYRELQFKKFLIKPYDVTKHLTRPRAWSGLWYDAAMEKRRQKWLEEYEVPVGQGHLRQWPRT
jgi:hypothetical protein